MKTCRPAVARQAILSALKAAGRAGIRTTDMPAIAGCSQGVVKTCIGLLRDTGTPIFTVRIAGGPMTYVWGQMPSNAVECRHRMPWRGAKAAMLDRLTAAAPQGITVEAMIAGLKKHGAMKAVKDLRSAGKLHSKRMPGMDGHALYFLHAEDCAAAYAKACEARHEAKKKRERDHLQRLREKHAATPKPPKQAKAVALPKASPRPAPKYAPAPSGPMIVPAHVQVQRLPSGTDSRWIVDRPTPYFSALAVGSYAPGDTWAARVYGSGA